ncbi:MAG: hypothetical protein SFV32_04495 [Opitutaceae bacterium]|nr:hypothetical protein [Opitutaceae bacterium]
MLRPLLFLAAFLALLSPAQTMSVIEPTLDDLVAESATVVRAVTESVESFEAVSPTGVRYAKTRVTWKVERALKGEAGERMQLEFLGGEVGSLRTLVPGMPQFSPGDIDYLFVSPTRRSICPLVAGDSGRFPVSFEAGSGSSTVPKAARHLRLQVSSTSAQAQPAPTRAPSDDDFEAAIRARVSTGKP